MDRVLKAKRILSYTFLKCVLRSPFLYLGKDI